MYSKRVLDIVVKSNFCQGCNLWKTKKKVTIDDYSYWYEDHKEQCTINHVSSAGKIKVDANFRDESCIEHSRHRSTEIAKGVRNTSRKEKSWTLWILYGPGLADWLYVWIFLYSMLQKLQMRFSRICIFQTGLRDISNSSYRLTWNLEEIFSGCTFIAWTTDFKIWCFFLFFYHSNYEKYKENRYFKFKMLPFF